MSDSRKLPHVFLEHLYNLLVSGKGHLPSLHGDGRSMAVLMLSSNMFDKYCSLDCD